MRLINTTTLRLEEFYGSAPEYAILSHTWAGGEVTFEEFVQCPEGSKQGYAKITAMCSQARVDGIGYCWVDTCCIVKTSSAELTESINSMFDWYKQAKVCFAFLADFDLDVDVAESVASRIEKCRWFTRGWCLQELIAPRELRFYDCNWRLVGTKRSLRGPISKITSVDQDVLEDSSRLFSSPIARRMSWASNRQTTRIEDMAYSLLGIFDINMPMLYGEGEKAFLRLQEEIIKKSNDLSIFAWKPGDSKSVYIDMFAPSPVFFDGCHDILDGGLGGHMLSRSLFSMSNRGIQFTAADISVLKAQTSQEGPDYVLPLNCSAKEAKGSCCKYLLLKKIGPGLFVRANTSGDLEVLIPYLERPWTVEREMYILPRVTLDLYPTLETSHRSSFEFRTTKAKLTSFSIQGLEPRDAWDTPRSRFLTQGNPSFVGYLKIYPEIATGPKTEFFVVALGFRRRHGTDAEPYVSLVHPDVWVTYDAPGRTLAWMVSSAVDEQADANKGLQRDGQELNLPRHKVTVALHTRVSRDLPVHKVLLDWKPHSKGKRKHGEVVE